MVNPGTQILRTPEKILLKIVKWNPRLKTELIEDQETPQKGGY